jgi:polysaccharide deacetylase family protein (PEP-CTERM system associated)
MINALTVDLEPWHVGELLHKHVPGQQDDQIEVSARRILNLLDKYETKATFFILGVVAEKYPEIVHEIYNKGHEVASHCYSHLTLSALGEKASEAEIIKSVKLLESITGEKPIGFRAPSFSINNSTKWALRILAENGFIYDSSIFPIKLPVRVMDYGLPDAPIHPYKPSLENVTQEDPNGRIIEFPLTVLKLVQNIPVAGGFYLRVLPLWFLKFAIRRVNKTRMAVVYIHPWETYSGTPALYGTPLFSRFITRYGIGSALGKLEGLLKEFKFQPLCRFLENAENSRRFVKSSSD